MFLILNSCDGKAKSEATGVYLKLNARYICIFDARYRYIYCATKLPIIPRGKKSIMWDLT